MKSLSDQQLQSGYLDPTALVRWIEDGRRRSQSDPENVNVPKFKREKLVANAAGR